MKVLLAVMLLALAALLGARKSFDRVRLPMSANFLVLSGVEFLLLGMLMGEGLLGLLDTQTLDRLSPFVGFALGWAGFLFGSQFSIRRMRSLPVKYFSVAMMQALVAFAFVLAACVAVIRLVFPADLRTALIAGVVLAGAGSSTAQSALAIVKRHYSVPAGGLMELLRYISAVDAVVGVVAVGAAICAGSPGKDTRFAFWGFFSWLGISVCLALVTVLVFVTMTLYRFSRQELFLIIIGILTLSSSLALSLGLCPVFINFLSGFLMANLSRNRERVIDLLAANERPIYILLLTVAGAFFSVPEPSLFLLLAVYLAARIAGKLAGGFVSCGFLDWRKGHRIGLGLLSHGGLSLVLAVNLYLLSPTELGRSVLAVVILSMLIFEWLAPRLVVRTLRAAGEIA